MPTLNSSYISDLQTRDLDQKIQDSRNTVDLWYEGYDATYNKKFEQYGVYSHINRVLLWLSSKPYDYIRESFKGGVLYSLLGQITTDTNLSSWENEIRDRFNQEFANDLSLLYIKLTMDKTKRILYINMAVRDAITSEVYPISTEAEF